jgi:superfamily II DNA or RNA helicase
MKKFRPYQSEAANAILAAWKAGQNCITVVATGGGKTLIAAGTTAKAKAIGNSAGRVLFLANRNELCTQPLEAFRDQLGYVPALEKGESFAPLSADVVIGSVQTLSRKKRLERFPRDHFQYIFADECHMSVAQSWKRIFEHFSSAKRCGITATPFRSDGKKLADLFEVEAYRKDLLDLVDDGYLVNPDHVDKLKTAISLAQVRVKHTTSGLDYDVNDAADAIEPYFREIAKELAQKHASRKILAFLPLVVSSQKFVAACRAEGINAVHIDGEDPERDQKLEAFRQGRIALLSNSNLLHTGVDLIPCDATLCLRPTRSKVLYQQVVGRSTRILPGTIDGIEDGASRRAAIAASTKPMSYIIDPLWLSNDFDLCTPSFLVANSQEEAVQMTKRAGPSYSLRQLRRQVQLEREEAIRRRLEATAKFREGRIPATLLAAGLHDHSLLNYTPVYAWEAAPPTRFSRLVLSKAGIDPESVKSEGLAREIMRAIGRRRFQGLAEIRALGAAADAGVADIWDLSKEQARAYMHQQLAVRGMV